MAVFFPTQFEKKSMSVTDIRYEAITHVWNIKNFSLYPTRKVLESSWTVKTGVCGELKWKLTLSQRRDQHAITLLICLQCEKEEVDFDLLLAIQDKAGKETFKQRQTTNHPNSPSMIAVNVLYSTLGLKGIQMTPKDDFTISCKMILKGNVVTSGQRYLEENNSCILNDLEKIFETKKLSDVTLSVDGQDFQAHKVILSARSPVFRAMFDYDTAENQNNRVVITDVKQEVFTEMLKFIYTDNVDNIDSMVFELMIAADKYDLGSLRCLCAQILGQKSQNLDTVVETLILADMHSVDTLKSQALSFIFANAKDLVDTEGFKSMEKTHPHLLSEVLRASKMNLKELYG